jgi:hypothetical protein
MALSNRNVKVYLRQNQVKLWRLKVNNISVISWWQVVVVGETGLPRESQRSTVSDLLVWETGLPRESQRSSGSDLLVWETGLPRESQRSTVSDLLVWETGLPRESQRST